jgi:uncharacterized protein (TIGR02284 family)
MAASSSGATACNRRLIYSILLTEVTRWHSKKRQSDIVIEVLHDGERGFKSFGEELKEPQFKSYFIEEALTRGQYAAELERALSVESGKQVTEGGTASGAVHRAWGELKSKLGGSDHTILETAEQGEDVAKKAYEEALKVEGIPLTIRTLFANAANSHTRLSQ